MRGIVVTSELPRDTLPISHWFRPLVETRAGLICHRHIDRPLAWLNPVVVDDEWGVIAAAFRSTFILIDVDRSSAFRERR